MCQTGPESTLAEVASLLDQNHFEEAMVRLEHLIAGLASRAGTAPTPIPRYPWTDQSVLSQTEARSSPLSGSPSRHSPGKPVPAPRRHHRRQLPPTSERTTPGGLTRFGIIIFFNGARTIERQYTTRSGTYCSARNCPIRPKHCCVSRPPNLVDIPQVFFAKDSST